MVFQAYVDDSWDPDGHYVLGGIVASAENWVNFSKQWELALPKGTLGNNDYYHFKMSEMAFSEERMERLPMFYRIIEDHADCFISARFNTNDLENAKRRVLIPSIKLNWSGTLKYSYLMAFDMLMSGFHRGRIEVQERLFDGQKVDFIFDEQTEKKFVLEGWSKFVSSQPPLDRQLYGATPRFESDVEFLPLQAADFWAWWVRNWQKLGKPENIRSRDFSGFSKSKKCPSMDIYRGEDGFLELLAQILSLQLPKGTEAFDRKTGKNLREIARAGGTYKVTEWLYTDSWLTGRE